MEGGRTKGYLWAARAPGPEPPGGSEAAGRWDGRPRPAPGAHSHGAVRAAPLLGRPRRPLPLRCSWHPFPAPLRPLNRHVNPPLNRIKSRRPTRPRCRGAGALTGALPAQGGSGRPAAAPGPGARPRRRIAPAPRGAAGGGSRELQRPSCAGLPLPLPLRHHRGVKAARWGGCFGPAVRSFFPVPPPSAPPGPRWFLFSRATGIPQPVLLCPPAKAAAGGLHGHITPYLCLETMNRLD